MKKITKEKMVKYAQSLPASTAKAQCYAISDLTDGKSIAEALLADHANASHAKRAAQLMVAAGAAVEIDKQSETVFGTFVFEDGSRL